MERLLYKLKRGFIKLRSISSRNEGPFIASILLFGFLLIYPMYGSLHPKETGIYLVGVNTPAGTAFKIGPKTLMTAAHVCLAIENTGQITVIKGKTHLKVTSVKYPPDVKADACILHTETKVPGNTFKLSTREVNYKEPITSYGYGNAKEPLTEIRSEVIDMVRNVRAPFLYGDQVYIVGDGLIIPGMSGGPVLAQDGTVVGINSMLIFNPNQNISQATNYVRGWAEKELENAL